MSDGRDRSADVIALRAGIVQGDGHQLFLKVRPYRRHAGEAAQRARNAAGTPFAMHRRHPYLHLSGGRLRGFRQQPPAEGVQEDGTHASHHGNHSPDRIDQPCGCRRHANTIEREGHSQVLHSLPITAASNLVRLDHRAEPISDDDDIARFDGNVRAGADGNADVRLHQGRRIVDPIAYHCHPEALVLQDADLRRLLVGEDLRIDLVDANLRGHRARCVLIVSCEHDGLDAELARRDPKTSRIILLQAIPQRKRPETYGGYVFITLRDPQNTTAIDGKISKGLVERLEWGREHLFSGIVQYDRFNDRVTVQFLIGTIEGAGIARQPSKEELLAPGPPVWHSPTPAATGYGTRTSGSRPRGMWPSWLQPTVAPKAACRRVTRRSLAW